MGDQASSRCAEACQGLQLGIASDCSNSNCSTKSCTGGHGLSQSDFVGDGTSVNTCWGMCLIMHESFVVRVQCSAIIQQNLKAEQSAPFALMQTLFFPQESADVSCPAVQAQSTATTYTRPSRLSWAVLPCLSALPVVLSLQMTTAVVPVMSLIHCTAATHHRSGRLRRCPTPLVPSRSM